MKMTMSKTEPKPAGARWPAARGGRGSGADGSARPGLPRAGGGDLAELVQDLVQQREVAGAQVGLPLREGLVACRRGYLDLPPAALLDHDQPGAAIRGVGDPADIAQALQLIDQHAGALLAHLCLVSEVREARTVRGDALKQPALGEGPVVEPGILEGTENPVLGVPVRDEQRHP